MSEDKILLKIKREFVTDEAVQLLLKKISNLEQEIGVLKSELAEKEDEIHKLRHNEVNSKKGWLRDELIADINQEMLLHKNLHDEDSKRYKELELKLSRVLVELQKYKSQ